MSAPFGLEPDQLAGPRVIVAIDRDTVTVSEVLLSGQSVEHAVLPRERWGLVSKRVLGELNAGLAQDGLPGCRPPQGRWSQGENLLESMRVGKETAVLTVALEQATDDAEVEVIVGAWSRMARVERWWLFNAGRDHTGRVMPGWRLALYCMLSARHAGPELAVAVDAPWPGEEPTITPAVSDRLARVATPDAAPGYRRLCLRAAAGVAVTDADRAAVSAAAAELGVEL